MLFSVIFLRYIYRFFMTLSPHFLVTFLKDLLFIHAVKQSDEIFETDIALPNRMSNILLGPGAFPPVSDIWRNPNNDSGGMLSMRLHLA